MHRLGSSRSDRFQLDRFCWFGVLGTFIYLCSPVFCYSVASFDTPFPSPPRLPEGRTRTTQRFHNIHKGIGRLQRQNLSRKSLRDNTCLSVSDYPLPAPVESTAADATTSPELFSVAPMMGHTHRHYHYFYRQISHFATFYTEMIPAAQMVAAYKRNPAYQHGGLSVEEVLCVLLSSREKNEDTHLDALVKMSPDPLLSSGSNAIHNDQHHPIVLQLGGRDPHTLGLAAAMGTFYGYHGINLNCGCPSNAVSGGDRSGGAALMREPSLVAECVEAMSDGMEAAFRILLQQQPNTSSSLSIQKPTLSVKHRLGVHDAATYDADADRRDCSDHDAFLTCRDFVRAITLGGDVAKVQVHARLGLLGDFDRQSETNSANTNDRMDGGGRSTLWVPGATTASTSASPTSKKVDHKRLQYRAKQKARQATIQNRSVPPLRPGVVDLMAAEFPNLEVITNGGIQSMQAIQKRMPSDSQVAGAMVGRAAINHPCAFGSADKLWSGHSLNLPIIEKPTREAVLLDYIQYCAGVEESFITSTLNNHNNQRRAGNSLGALVALRRRLVAVPFQLFAGELGSEEYQRRIRKLIARAERHTSSSILTAALSVVPTESLLKPVDQYATEANDLKVYKATYQRSGPLQRTIF